MTIVYAEIIICTLIVGLACIAFIAILIKLILFIKESHDHSHSNKIIISLTIISFVSYFISCLFILISFIIVLIQILTDPSADECQPCRNTRGISMLLLAFGKAALVLVLIQRLKNCFRNTIHRVSKCVVQFLYIQIIFTTIIRISITVFIISDTYFNLAMIFGFVTVVVDAVVFSITVYLFCSKLQTLLLSEAYSAASHIDLDLVKVMTRYSLLVIAIVVNQLLVMFQALFFAWIAPRNETFYKISYHYSYTLSFNCSNNKSHQKSIKISYKISIKISY
eukprot:244617_1